jgi:hypothetical protein
MRTTYTQRHDNEGWEQKSGESFKIECCDCGLVHRVVVVTDNLGETIGLAAKRDKRATAQRRRRRQNVSDQATASARRC